MRHPSTIKSQQLRRKIRSSTKVSFLFRACSAASNHFEVTTPVGKIRGIVEESILRPELKYASFLGIPYARKPVGEYRFKVRTIHLRADQENDETSPFSPSLNFGSEPLKR